MKYKVGVLMGGYSSEYEISLKSGEVVFTNLDTEKFEGYRVHILKDGWYVLDNGQKFDVDKNDFSFFKDGEKVQFDVVFNAIHGTPGEDGKLQGLLELLNLKHTSSDAFESALTFNKAKCNLLLKQWGIKCADSVFLLKKDIVDPQEIGDKLGFPLFVKPNRSGSSFGVSRVEEVTEIVSAIADARNEDDQVLIESAILGREVGCGVARLNGYVTPIAITEIVSKKAFFDYEAKYEGASNEITPADIDIKIDREIREISTRVYEQLGLKGVARIDFIIDEKKNKPYLIEVNTVPGLSPESIVPQQALHYGFSLKDFFTLLLNEALKG